MQATIKEIELGMQAINILMNSRLPSKVSYSVSKLARACTSEMEDFQKEREKVFKDHKCIMNETGTNNDGSKRMEWVHPEGVEKMKEVLEEIESLRETEVSVNALALDIDQFKDKDGKEIELAGGAFFGIEWAMKDYVAPKKPEKAPEAPVS